MSYPFGRDKGPYLGLTSDGPAHYPGELHLMLWGGNGSGKDTRIITPLLAQLRRSCLVVDPKGEQCAITMRHRAKFSKIVVINPYDLLVDTHPWMKSHGFNPLARADFDPSDKTFNHKATSLGDFLVKVDGPEAFFATGAKALVSGLIMWERILRGRAASLANVRRMLTEPYGVEDGQPTGLFKTLLDMKQHGFGPMVSKTNRFLSPSNSSRDVIQTAIGQTGFLDEPFIAEDLSKGTFDFGDLKHGDELVTVYLILPADKLETDANWLRLLVGMALRDLMRTKPGAGPRPLLVLNEVGQLGYLEPLATGMGIARGFGVQIMTVWQSGVGQIRKIYKEDFPTFIGARGCLSAFSPQEWESAEYLSKLCGHRTELMPTVNAKPGQAQTELQDTAQGFPLMRPEDLMRLPAGTLVNFTEPVPFPYLTTAPGYWQTPWASGLDPNPYYVAPRNFTPRTQRAAPRPSPQVDHRKALDDLQRRRGKE